MTMAYSPRVDAQQIDALEAAATEIGLSLNRLELLGQAPGLVDEFVDSVDGGYHQAFLDVVDWNGLQQRLQLRQRAVQLACQAVTGDHSVAKPERGGDRAD